MRELRLRSNHWLQKRWLGEERAGAAEDKSYFPVLMTPFIASNTFPLSAFARAFLFGRSKQSVC